MAYEENNQANVQTAKNASKRVLMVIYPDAHILDVVGPLEVLTGSKLFLPEGTDPYEVQVVAEKAGRISTTSGIALEADHSFSDVAADPRPTDTLIVAGGHGTSEALENKALLDFVAGAAVKARRIVSICTGAMILAQIGLLDGRRATTHWWWCPIMANRYPAVIVEPDAIFVRDGNIWTSAGVTAGMDLALALLEEDWGHDIALEVARYNVMYMMRPGGQAQFSANLLAQKASDSRIASTLDFILAHVGDDLNVTSLAARACMSERSFARKFKDEMGATPAHYVEIARLQAARVALEQSERSVDVIAHEVGFGAGERMRRVFQRHLGVSPSDYRERFSLTAKPEAGEDPP